MNDKGNSGAPDWIIEIVFPGMGTYCKAVHAVYEYCTQSEILTDNKSVTIGNRDDILKLEEKGNMTIRGLRTILKSPVMITFVNQTQVVDVTVA